MTSSLERSALRRGAMLRQFSSVFVLTLLALGTAAPAIAADRQAGSLALETLVDPSALFTDGSAASQFGEFRTVDLAEVLSIDPEHALNAKADEDKAVKPVTEVYQVRIAENARAEATRTIPRKNFTATLKTTPPEPADFDTAPILEPINLRVTEGTPLPPVAESDGLTLRDHLNQMVVPAPATLLLCVLGAACVRPFRRFIQQR